MKMKKRTIIALVLTLLGLLFSSNFWLKFKPVPVDFDIKSSNDYSFNVFLDNNDNSGGGQFQAFS